MSVPLSAALAQRIIDLASPNVPFNINIMDSTGLIIAAVDPARVGTIHPGARRALERGDEYHVHVADTVSGIQPGVNLPFRSGDRVVGVVGVTGPPAEVETVARILRVTVELTISIEADQSSAELREARDRAFLSRLVHDPHAISGGSLEHELARIHGPWRLTVYFVRDAASPSTWPASILREIEAEYPHVPRRWAIFEDALWVFGAELRGIGSREGSRTMSISTVPTHDVAYLASATHIARAIMSQPSVLSTERTHWSTDELAAEAAVATANSSEVNALAFPLRRVSRRHREILLSYIEANGNIAAIARKVGVHRNSVTRRLDTLYELTGHDARSSTGIVALTLALAAERRLSGENAARP
ncbi:sugar diacid recognition domain-containing protein [Microbacterium sp. YY-01]|uniref:sugar diacid recognition domain-containing protein n=1 Tax=Microbacterium sp. YY-01 TaxID=3421634 RepID=UPI003D173882